MDKNVYVSITSIYSRQDRLFHCILSVLKQSYLPNNIYLYLSEESSFFDSGFRNKQITFEPLNILIKENKIIEIIWGNDIGPFGKLLPLLKNKWEEDCLIITLDDDTIYYEKLIEQLIQDYNREHCVISYRGFTANTDNIKELKYYNRKNKTESKSLFNFPTGKGGILYHPYFFHKTRDLIFNRNIYNLSCPKADDIWLMIIRYLNNIECYIDNKRWLNKDLHINDNCLFVYNNEENQIQIENTIKKLEELGFII